MKAVIWEQFGSRLGGKHIKKRPSDARIQKLLKKKAFKKKLK